MDIQFSNSKVLFSVLHLIPNFCAIKKFNHLLKQIVNSQIEHLWNCLVCFNLDFITLFSFEPYKINLFVLVWFRQLNHIGYCSKIVREGGFFKKMFYISIWYYFLKFHKNRFFLYDCITQNIFVRKHRFIVFKMTGPIKLSEQKKQNFKKSSRGPRN